MTEANKWISISESESESVKIEKEGKHEATISK